MSSEATHPYSLPQPLPSVASFGVIIPTATATTTAARSRRSTPLGLRDIDPNDPSINFAPIQFTDRTFGIVGIHRNESKATCGTGIGIFGQITINDSTKLGKGINQRVGNGVEGEVPNVQLDLVPAGRGFLAGGCGGTKRLTNKACYRVR